LTTHQTKPDKQILTHKAICKIINLGFGIAQW
jgi:hypothetical protein